MHAPVRLVRLHLFLLLLAVFPELEMRAQLYHDAAVCFSDGAQRDVVLLFADEEGVYVDYRDANWTRPVRPPLDEVCLVRMQDIDSIVYYGRPLPVLRGFAGGCLGWGAGLLIGPLAGAGIGVVVDAARGDRNLTYTGALALVGLFAGMIVGAILGADASVGDDDGPRVFLSGDTASLPALRARCVY